MKRIIFSLALLAGIGTAAQAQGVKYGLKGGFNGTKFYGPSTNKGVEYKAGFAAGGFLNFGLSDNFSFQPELLYSQKGASIDNFQGSDGTTFKTTLGYLDVPLIARFNTGEAGKGFFLELGPQGSVIIHTRDFTQRGSNKSTANTSTDDLNKVVLGYVGGIGYQITSGLSIGVRYSGDISQVYKDGASKNYLSSATLGLNGRNPNLHNSVFQFQVGYGFGGK